MPESSKNGAACPGRPIEIKPILKSNFRREVGSGALRLTRAANQRRVVMGPHASRVHPSAR